jgi:dTMP kinase
MTGLFITVEGIDGSGKTTQWHQLTDWLKATYPNREIVQTRNPGGTKLGQAIRSSLLTPLEAGDAPINPMAELLLYMADRAQHIAEVVKPALERNAIVVCDRFVDSSVAYQGTARGLRIDTILKLNELACQGIEPTLTLLFDACPTLLAQRVSQRGAPDRLEQEGLSFQAKVREGFLALAQANPHRIKLIDASQPLAVVSQQAQALLATILESALGAPQGIH